MEQRELEDAIRSDLEAIPLLKMKTVPAKNFYGKGFAFIFKLSFMLFGLNTVLHILLMMMGLYPITFAFNIMLFTWATSFGVCLLLGLFLSRLSLIWQMIEGRLKTEKIFKETFRHASFIGLGVYIGTYVLITIFMVIHMDEHWKDFGVLVSIALMTQGFSFLTSTWIMGFMMELELERAGLAPLFNVLGEVISKARNTSVEKGM